MKSLPFYVPEAWKRYPFRAEPPRIGHYREYPPPPGGLSLIDVLVLNPPPHIEWLIPYRAPCWLSAAALSVQAHLGGLRLSIFSSLWFFRPCLSLFDFASASIHVQYTQTESIRLRHFTIRLDSKGVAVRANRLRVDSIESSRIDNIFNPPCTVHRKSRSVK